MKMDKIKNENGITLITLVITIIVLLILTSIVVRYGKESIIEANIQNLQTNMLLIEAKAKKFVENANYDLGVKPDEATEEMKIKSASELKGTKITDGDSIVNQLTSIGINLDDIKNGNVYKLTKADLTDMEIKGVESDDENGWYIIVYDVTNADVKIYNTSGVKVDDTQKYCLDDIKNIEV